MIEAVAAANPNTIVVLNTGGPVLMPWLSSVKGVLEAWYAGRMTAARSHLCCSATPIRAATPETFPTSLSAIPTAAPSQFPGVNGRSTIPGLDVGYRWYDAEHVTPLFPFGFGLSYTTFRFSNLTVTPGAVVNRVSGPEPRRAERSIGAGHCAPSRIPDRSGAATLPSYTSATHPLPGSPRGNWRDFIG